MPQTDARAANHFKGKAKAMPSISSSSLRKASSSHQRVDVYSIRDNPLTYVQQLKSTPLSDIRNDTSHKRRYPHIASSFNEIGVSTPVPSKRFRHQPYDTENDNDRSVNHQQILSTTTTNTSQPQPDSSERHPPSSSSSPSSSTTPSSNTKPIPPKKVANEHHKLRSDYAYRRASLQVPLTLDAPVAIGETPTPREKEKEFWRRQRRVFVRSRYITNEEAADVANGIHLDQPIDPNDRIIVSCQGNIANFRSKWRKLVKEQANTLGFGRTQVVGGSARLENNVTPKVNQRVVEAVWGYWLSLPYVDAKEFYATQPDQVAVLKSTTIKAICIALKYKHKLISEREFRKQLDDLDKYTRSLALC